MGFKNILVEKEAGIAIIEINRPEERNALNLETIAELEKALDAASADSEVRVVILTGAGEKAFASGGDLRELKEMTAIEGRKFAELGHRITRKIEEMEKPVIAAVNGYALGGGCEVAIACDIIIASENAKFGHPEVSIGISPGWGTTQRLPRWVGVARAKEIIFTSDMIDAAEARRMGLINRVVPKGELMKYAREMANKIASKAPVAIKYSKAAIHEGIIEESLKGLAYEIVLFSRCFETEDQKEGMRAFLEKRKPEFKGK